MWTWWGLGVATAACPTEHVDTELHLASLDYERAVLSGAEGRTELLRRTERVEELIGCLGEPADDRDVYVALHKSMGLAAFLEGDLEAARRRWGAARTLDDLQTLDPALGSDAARVWEEARVRGGTVDFKRKPHGGWYVNGEKRTDYPEFQSFVLQARDARKVVVWSGLVDNPGEVPEHLDWQALDRTAWEVRQTNWRTGMRIVSGVSLVASAASLGVAARAHNQALDPSTPVQDVQGLAETANAGSWASIGLLGAGLTAGGVSFVFNPNRQRAEQQVRGVP